MKISSYTFGKIVIDAVTYSSDVIIYPARVDASWRRKKGHRLAMNDLSGVWRQHPETLIIGTGCHGRMAVPEATREAILAKKVDLRAVTTDEAVVMFNKLAAMGKVVAALHLTC